MKTIYFRVFLVLLFIYSNNDVYADTEIDFIENRQRFVSEGFGFTYELNKNMQLFILNQGQPKNIIKTRSILSMNYRVLGMHPYTWELEYERFIALFSGGWDYKKQRMTTYDENRLSRINSKNNVEYLFGIKNGMSIDDLENIFGKINDKDIRSHRAGGYTIQFFGNDKNGIYIDILFNKIGTMTWYF